jgi:hypothetical protein
MLIGAAMVGGILGSKSTDKNKSRIFIPKAIVLWTCSYKDTLKFLSQLPSISFFFWKVHPCPLSIGQN